MSFFHQIHELGDNADLTIYFFRKDDKLTIEVRPGARTSLNPKTMTGTPEDLASGFLQALLTKPEPKAGLNVQDLPDEGKPTKEAPEAKEKPAPAKKGNAAKKGKPVKSKPESKTKASKASKPVAPKEASIFDQAPADNAPSVAEVEVETVEEVEGSVPEDTEDSPI